MNTNNLKMLLGSAGALAGLYYAFTKNKGAWAYVGYFLVGGIAGNLAGQVVGGVISPTTTAPSRQGKTTSQQDKTQTTKPSNIKGTAIQVDANEENV